MIKAARQLGWSGDAPGAGGALILLSLLAARAAASASAERVYVFGFEAHWPCLFSQLFSLPCPGCGLTRGTLLTLDGRLGEAFALNPAAPLVVFGVVALAGVLLALALYRRAHAAHAASLFARRLRAGVRLYGALLGAALLANWLAELFGVR
jgi:hypothetical protein